jgi:hypothetical protein
MHIKPGRQIIKNCLILLGVILFGGLACGMPVSTIPSTVTALPLANATRTPLPPVSRPTATGAPTAAAEVGEVQIYLVAVGDGGSNGKAVGCGDSLIPVKHQIQATRQPIVFALTELFAIKQQFLGQSGLYNALYQSNLRVESAEVDANGIATVVLTGPVMMGGECDIPRFKGQIEQTILAASGAQSANILLNGKTIDQALSLK